MKRMLQKPIIPTGGNMHQNNVLVAKKFEILADLYEQQGNTHKARAFTNASETILSLGDEDIAQVYKARKLPTIGDSSKKEIEEILRTGTSIRIDVLTRVAKNKGEDTRVNILEVLTDIIGLDMSDATRLMITHGITSLTVLRKLVFDEIITHIKVVEGMAKVDEHFGVKE